MKNKPHRIAPFLLIALLSAENIFSQTTNAPTGASTNAPGRGNANNNNNDAFYKLGPDSMPMDGVPQGHFVGPTVIPTQVFPGNFHTYWVYVPAQYDPTKPTPIMIFNDGQAFKNPNGS